ncbi:MAG: hypothetical protein NT154_15095, partial [Verrucomicrobia bacterium]|nr:hypothetical protein [Verrucomicrobiota bacterium]
RLKVYGRTMGTLCQYSGRYYDAEDVTFEDIGGPEDTVMESIAPTGFQRIDQGQGASFTFLPLFPALPPKDDYPAAGQWLGGPALAIYWPGRRPESFPWYLSTGDAVVSEREGPLTTD